MRSFLSLLVCLGLLFSTGCGSSGGSSNPVAAAASPLITATVFSTVGGQTKAIIQGSGFTATRGQVRYGAESLYIEDWTDTQILVWMSSNTQSGSTFTVIAGGVTSPPSQPVSLVNPVISGVSPTSGTPGTLVTITGTGFGTTGTVTFNGYSATVQGWSPSLITCTVPTSAQGGTGTLTVNAENLKTAYTTFTVIQPRITSVTSADGSSTTDNPGAEVRILGEGFGESQSSLNGQVQVGSSNIYVAPLSWSSTQIRFRLPTSGLPAGYQQVKLVLNTTTYTSGITVAAPVLTSYPTANVGQGDQVTIIGQYFGVSQNEGNGSILIKAVSGTTQQYVSSLDSLTWSDSQLSFKWPITNDWIGTKQMNVTVSVGGLSTTFTITAK